MSKNTITVINRTGNNVWSGIDNEQYVTHPRSSQYDGNQGKTLLGPGDSHTFTISGNAIANNDSFQVGFTTCFSGGAVNWPAQGVILYQVFPGSLVTLATEVGTRGDTSE